VLTSGLYVFVLCIFLNSSTDTVLLTEIENPGNLLQFPGPSINKLLKNKLGTRLLRSSHADTFYNANIVQKLLPIWLNYVKSEYFNLLTVNKLFTVITEPPFS